MSSCDIRVLDADGIGTAVEWARREGWNPGHRDAEVFAATDPNGFLGLYVAGELAATISLVSYRPHFAFLGFFICRPDLRGQGLGLALWNAALARQQAAVIGLDGVPAQQSNYRKSGFVLAHRTIRHGGVRPRSRGPMAPGLKTLSADDGPAIDRFEQLHQLFPASRTGFLKGWLSHQALALWRSGNMAGYGVIRACHAGWKVGPLFAASPEDAREILHGLLAGIPEAPIFLDTPESNAAAIDLARAAGLLPVFETARMYRGAAPALDTSMIFGVTTFELG